MNIEPPKQSDGSEYPLVTVFVPVYNHEKYIETCLNSIAAEDYPSLELLILDDGSKDNSYPIAKQWADRNRERFINIQCKTQSNSGICKTLNRLLSDASGRFCTMVASDDALISGGIQARVKTLQEHPEWLGVFGDAETMDENGCIYQSSALREEQGADLQALLNPDRIAHELMLRWSIPGPVLLCRREAWDTSKGVGTYDEELFLEDRDFYLRLLSRRALGFVNVPVARYRIHSSNACRDRSVRNRLRETLWKSNLKNIKNFKGSLKWILMLQTKERFTALHGMPLQRLFFKILLALFRVRYRRWL